MLREKEIRKEREGLEKIAQKVTMELEKLHNSVQDGIMLRTARHGEGYQYFLRKHGSETNGKYIKKKEMKVAQSLAQIEYDDKLIKNLNKSIRALRTLESVWEDDLFGRTAGQLAPGKRSLVKPPLLSDEDFIRNWLNQKFDGLEFDEKAPEYYTRRGLRVRSKSEILIAEVLDEMSIPFLYEKSLRLDASIVHPDFTLLNIKERKEVYWEHFGMMDDMEYRNNTFLKIRKYEANGFCRYDSFIWTEETGRYPLDMKSLRKMVRKMKEKLGYDAG